MILIIDNYDSFVHNLARYFREAGAQTKVLRNDALSVAACLDLNPSGVVVSPGPKAPVSAGISCDLIRALPENIPFLGVCLGSQCLVEVFGGKTQKAAEPLHGEASAVHHLGEGIFTNIPSPMFAGRYHSLASTINADSPLVKTAWTENDAVSGDIMGVAHRDRPWFGVQFHPESLLTPDGRTIIENFLALCSGEAR